MGAHHEADKRVKVPGPATVDCHLDLAQTLAYVQTLYIPSALPGEIPNNWESLRIRQGVMRFRWDGMREGGAPAFGLLSVADWL
jgi:hypothetical protein